MSSAVALVLAASLAIPDALEAARAAFSRADYERAASLALEAARPPREGAALYLAGLARFRAGQHEAALRALDQAGRAADPPPAGQWAFNRASCLYELGRFAEAEEAWLAAAGQDPSLAVLSLVNAAWAALDGGAVERARELSHRARAASDGPGRELVAELEARLASPRPDASREGPGDQGSNAAGGIEATRPATAERDGALHASLRLGAAYDSNPFQAGVLGQTELLGAAPAASAAASLSAEFSWRRRLAVDLGAQLAYSVDQLAFLESSAADRSLQSHLVAAALELSPGERLHLGAIAHGQLSFAGLASFRGLEGTLGAATWAALDEAESTTTRVELAWTLKHGFGSEFSYLTGDRIDVGLAQVLRLPPATLEASYRFRAELIGRLPVAAPAGLPDCQGCTYVIPFGYLGHQVQLSGRVPLGDRLRLHAASGLEWRRYLEDGYLQATVDNQNLVRDPRRRQDQRWYARLGASYQFLAWLEVGLRYDLVVNSSNVGAGPAHCGAFDPSCHVSDPADWNYNKQVVTAEAQITW